ncbi:MAG: RnfABCDGE type electron transport complex subunit D [Clostridia bacterium]|nr:RnfABCDGE type electron transport complex subunit D [Clostridia bacterium]
MSSKTIVSSSPHLHSGESTQLIMMDVIIALIPTVMTSVWLFGWRVLGVIAVTVASCVASEYLSRLVLRRPQTVADLSAVVTGLLLAFNLPSTVPLWQAALGGVVAIVVVKQMFGGIGQNFVNPALVGRIVLLMSFPATMATYENPTMVADAISRATPLAAAQAGQPHDMIMMFFGVHGGSLGETCTAALLIGFVYLLIRRVITPTIPLVMTGTVFVLSWIIEGSASAGLYQVLAGGLILGAVFMATDYTTSPITPLGKVIFAFGCGALTVLIRYYGALPEGVSFAIVIMNILVPLIERVTYSVPFGKKRGGTHA